MYFTYDVIFTLKDFNIIRENSCKIGNMSENVIKFYRYVKYFSERFLEHITLTASLFIHYIFLYVYLLFRFFYFLPYHHLFQFFVHFLHIISLLLCFINNIFYSNHCKNNSFIYLIDEKFNRE